MPSPHNHAVPDSYEERHAQSLKLILVLHLLVKALLSQKLRPHVLQQRYTHVRFFQKLYFIDIIKVMPGLPKFLIIIGLLITIIGIFLAVGPKIPWLGHLPGDIAIKKDNFQFYFPITTCILISIILSLIFYLFKK